jgi:hypothetical protein
VIGIKDSFRQYDATDRITRQASRLHLEHPTQHSTPLHGFICTKRIFACSPRDVRRDILLLRELNDYEGEVEYTYECIAELERDACKM